VLLFGMTLALVTGVGFGLIAGLLSHSKDFLAHLGDAARGGSRTTARLRTALTIVQIGATTVLLVTALLFAQTLQHLRNVSLGYDVEHVTQFKFDPTLQNYTPGRLAAFRRDLLNHLAARPGITSATLATGSPLSSSFQIDLGPAGFVGKHWPTRAVEFSISPAFFRTFGQPLLRGRTFTVAEAAGDSSDITRPIILSQGAARRIFGTDDVVGRQVLEREYKGNTTHTVIGIVGDTRTTGLRGAPDPTAYEPVGSTDWSFNLTLFVKSPLSARQVAATVQGVFAEIDPALPISYVEPMSQTLARAMAQERLFARLVSLLAVLAMFLAAVGLYGLIGFAVAERTREIGVRMALGARSGPLVGLIMGQATRLDASTYLAAAVVVVAIGAVASAQPTIAATHVNPVEALRHD
jgi:hypothetical protein